MVEDHNYDETPNPNEFLGVLSNPILRQFAHDVETQANQGVPYADALRNEIEKYASRLTVGEWSNQYTPQEIVQATTEIIKLALPPETPLTLPVKNNSVPINGEW